VITAALPSGNLTLVPQFPPGMPLPLLRSCRWRCDRCEPVAATAVILMLLLLPMPLLIQHSHRPTTPPTHGRGSHTITCAGVPLVEVPRNRGARECSGEATWSSFCGG
jgi:hypothetical protein